MRYLGIDLGTKRVGLAMSDLTNLIASPYDVVNFEDSLNIIKNLVLEYKITDLVVGIPKNMNNTIGESALNALEYSEKLKELEVAVHLIDERRTTILANNFMIDSNMSKKNRKSKVDSFAASIILQTYLDKKGR